MRRILFICTGNCVRSQMAEALLRYRGAGRFEVASAGTHPAGYVHAFSLAALDELRIRPRKPRSKGWQEFADTPFDAALILCDEAWLDLEEAFADTPLPPWKLRVHWPVEDPLHAEVLGEEAHLEAFRVIRDELRYMIERLATAPAAQIDDQRAFRRLLQEIAAED